MKQEFEMTEKDLKAILAACAPTMCIQIGGYSLPSPQENANAAWRALGDRMGFDGMTVEPSSRGDRFFLATPKKTEAQIRVEQLAAAKKRVAELDAAMAEARKMLEELR